MRSSFQAGAAGPRASIDPLPRRRSPSSAGVWVGAILCCCLMTWTSPTAGAAIPHAGSVYLAPFRSTGTHVVPVHVSVGCARSQGRPLTWDAISGRISGIGSVRTKVCARSQYGGSSTNSAQWEDQFGLSVPIRVATNGNHPIAVQWTIDLGAGSYATSTGCPSANLNFAIGVGNRSDGSCTSGTDLGFYLWAVVEDPNGVGGFLGNLSDVGMDNYTDWQNLSSCTNAGTLSCTNLTYGNQHLLGYGTNEVGSAAAGLGGSHPITMWVNGTNMSKSDRFELVMELLVYATSYASTTNLLGPWHAKSGALVDMASPGQGAVLDSITIG